MSRTADLIAAARADTVHRLHDGDGLGDAIPAALDTAGITNPTLRETTTAVLVEALCRHERCDVCRGELVGTERYFGICGHCGHRSLTPRRNL